MGINPPRWYATESAELKSTSIGKLLILGCLTSWFKIFDNSGNSASTQVEVTVFDPLSISENNFENLFKLHFPYLINPSFSIGDIVYYKIDKNSGRFI